MVGTNIIDVLQKGIISHGSGQIDPERPVIFIGYSLGALITLEALEDLVAAENKVGR